MADWDANSPRLTENLVGVLRRARAAAFRRDAPSLEDTRVWHRDMMAGLRVPHTLHVFPSPKKENASMAHAQKAIERVVERSGVDFRGHDLRRTAASLMVGAGVPRLVVSKILNHVETGVTAVYDRHSYDLEKRAALDFWGKRLEAIVSKRRAAKILRFSAAS